ncbi:MAG: hypothetical protein QXH80_00080 [Candidatus Nanoarchaeia archaeon]
MSKILLHEFSTCVDTGFLKATPAEYKQLQNIRGWGGLGSKRRGIRTSATFDYGIMGVFDLKLDEDPNFIDKIAIVDGNGSLWLYSFEELYSIFNNVHDSGVKLLLQSPDLSWWNCTPDEDGIILPTLTSEPASTITSDFTVAQDELYGFTNTNGIMRLSVNHSGEIETKQYTVTTSTGTYTSDRCFETGVGLVFETTELNRFRITVTNDGILQTEAIA